MKDSPPCNVRVGPTSIHGAPAKASLLVANIPLPQVALDLVNLLRKRRNF